MEPERDVLEEIDPKILESVPVHTSDFSAFDTEVDEGDHVTEAEFQQVIDAWTEHLDADEVVSTKLEKDCFQIRNVKAYVDRLKLRHADLKKPKGSGVYLPLKIEDEIDREAYPPGTVIGYIQTPIPGASHGPGSIQHLHRIYTSANVGVFEEDKERKTAENIQ
ncbi:hypothetical protein R1sor_015444 [Riccia sorocarpa]|uniref:Uncharacterized protein n=1 Tax=Riccia sorocarpa TaxID=122646 RepID=A0ABD3HG52_9MARC